MTLNQFEISDDLKRPLQAYLDRNPDRNVENVITMALAEFLLRNGRINDPNGSVNYRLAARVYLDTLYKHAI